MNELFKDLPDALKNNENFPLRISYRPVNSVPILPNIQTSDNKNIDEILKSIEEISKKIDKEKEGANLVDSLRKRVRFVKDQAFEKIPRVAAIEWIDPFFTSGHWVPEMIEIAGGKNLISSEKMPS